MTTSERMLRHEIVKIGRLLYERGLIVAGDGNISARLSDELVITTPAGACKGMLEPEDMVVVDLEGRVRGGRRLQLLRGQELLQGQGLDERQERGRVHEGRRQGREGREEDRVED